MIVAFSAEAEADLERIGDHIARDNPRRAMTFVAELVDRCERLGQIPEDSPSFPDMPPPASVVASTAIT